MNNLISGKEALIALANGGDVLVHESTYKDHIWFNLKDTTFSTGEIINGLVRRNPYKLTFRLKPKTVMLGNIEVPAPFEPKEDERFFTLVVDRKSGYDFYNYIDNVYCNTLISNSGAWRTEEEIKQVVEALRSVFK